MKLNFDKTNVAQLDFQTLRETVDESNLTGTPFNGFMHYVFIEKLMELATKANLKPEIQRIEAVANKNKYAPGVSQIPGMADKYGEHDHKSLLLRRIFADIALKDKETDDYVLSAAMIYHQRGVQIGLGPQVKSCKNLCIMGADHYASTYGSNQVENLEQMFQLFQNWFERSDYHFDKGIQFMKKIKMVDLNVSQFKHLIGSLFMQKSLADISSKNGVAFLKDNQISHLVDEFNNTAFNNQTKSYDGTMNAYDIYNLATEFHRPSYTDIPLIIEGNAKINELFYTELSEFTSFPEIDILNES